MGALAGENITLTILTPTYNRQKELHTLYTSLVNQTNHDFQWLVIDDGSEDETESWFLESVFSKNNPFIIDYHRKENGGKHTAINYSHSFVKGRYLVIVDSDDYLICDAVDSILSYWKKYEGYSNIGGITFQKGRVVGQSLLPMDTLHENEIVSSFAAETNRGMRGDHCETILTDLFCDFEFPVFINEKFVGEGAMWYLATRGYDVVYLSKIIYICEYQEGGLTKSGRKMRMNNPRGGMWHASVMMSRDFKFSLRVKNAILYCCYAKTSKLGILKAVRQSRYRMLTVMLWPIGEVFKCMWSK